jgi:hypothetical protein
MGGVRSGIDPFVRNFDCEISFASSATADRIAEGQDAAEPGSCSTAWVHLAEGTKEMPRIFPFAYGPNHGQFLVIQEA